MIAIAFVPSNLQDLDVVGITYQDKNSVKPSHQSAIGRVKKMTFHEIW